jgi:hypothetical protein
MAYCMTWELAGSRASRHWQGIHTFVAAANHLSERQRWTLELYEESPPSAQEERSIRSRIDAYLLQPRDVVYFRTGILNLLPEAMRAAAEIHSFMRGLTIPSNDYGKLKAWVMSWNLRRPQVSQRPVTPLAEREQEFERFLELPYFVESFRRFWRVSPKKRSNRRTRVLVCIGAAMSQMMRVEDSLGFEPWIQRLAVICHFSSQTKHDLCHLMDAMHGASYDVQELAYRLFVDARTIDQRNLERFIKRYNNDLSECASELASRMRFGSEPF